MKAHGVHAAGWRFAWSRGKRQLGSAQVRRRRVAGTGKIIETKTITLSRHLVALNGDEEVRETILHEIAHAIAGVRNGHNEIWKAACRRVGARPVRLAGEEVQTVQGRYIMYCPGCDRELGRRHRRMRSEMLARTFCRACGKASKGKLVLKLAEN
ncbi:MAG: hypothetical protein GC162_14320 [Planctomycetes bacterium]|nr:hypothetical protein [Planctomycetota bacterium]